MKATPAVWAASALLCTTPLALGQWGQDWDQETSGTANQGFALDYYHYYQKYAGRSAKDTIPPLIIQFTGADREKLAGLEEDLVVMAHLLYKGLEQGLGTDSPTMKANIPLLVTGSSRSVRAIYVEGFGALFMIKVNFPVLAPPRFEEKKPAAAADTDWELARREILNLDPDADPVAVVATPAPYDASLVEDLKRTLLQSFKQAANLRYLKPDEQVAVSAFGSGSVLLAKNTRNAAATATLAGRAGAKLGDALVEVARAAGLAQVQNQVNGQVEKKVAPQGGNPADPTPGENVTRPPKGSALTVSPAPVAASSAARRPAPASRDSGRGTVLAIRAKKSDVDAFAQGKLGFEQFAQHAVINSYLGYGHGITSVNSWTKDGRSSSSRR